MPITGRVERQSAVKVHIGCHTATRSKDFMCKMQYGRILKRSFGEESRKYTESYDIILVN